MAIAHYSDATSSGITISSDMYLMNTAEASPLYSIDNLIPPVQNKPISIKVMMRDDGTQAIKINKGEGSITYLSSISLKYKTDIITNSITGDRFTVNGSAGNITVQSTPTIYIDGNGIQWESSSTVDTSYFYGGALNPEQVKRLEFINRIRSFGIITKNSKSLGRFDEKTPEGRARGLLREMIGPQEFYKYLRRGSLTVVGKSGLHYVIYGNTIKVFAKTLSGKMKFVESICIVFKNHEALPPTDHVIMRKMMIEADEFGLRTIGNKSRMNKLDDVEPAARNVLEFRKTA